MKNIFDASVTNEVAGRINNLKPTSQPIWGKMTVAQMMAHCNVAYEMVYDDIHKKPNAFVKLMVGIFAKSMVVGDKPYKRNGPTGPQFVIKDSKDFNTEKERLIAYLLKTQALGGNHFNNKESHSFGKLTTTQWNTLFYKHLDHHLNQFGV